MIMVDDKIVEKVVKTEHEIGEENPDRIHSKNIDFLEKGENLGHYKKEELKYDKCLNNLNL